MIVNPIKQSTSTESLTGLNGTCDTACHFCNEGGDVENHRRLIDSKLYSNCQCRYAVHIDCWQTHLDMKTDKKYECPLCKTAIQSWRIKDAGFSVADKEQKKGYEWYVYVLVFSFILVIIFVSLLLGLSKH